VHREREGREGGGRKKTERGTKTATNGITQNIVKEKAANLRGTSNFNFQIRM
jgi:hypothetical protein